MLKPLP